MDRLLLLIPTTSYRVADFMAAAERLGIEVVVGSDRRSVLEDFSPGRTLTLDFADADDGAGRIAAYAMQNPLRAILGVDEKTAMVAALASEALGLTHNSPDSVAATVNKHRMRTALANSGLPVPGFSLAPIADGPAAAAVRVSYPCVLKPLALSGSRGVIRADDAGEFVAAYRRIAGILNGAAENILVEDYIPGAEVALEGLLEDGRLTTLALFDKPDAMEGPHFEETIYVTPSRLDAAMQRAVADTAARGAAALGLRHGPVHCELRINPRGVWIIEIAARSIGGLCARSLDFGAGVRLEDLILNHALGRPLADVRRDADAAGVMMIPIPSGGVLRGVGGLEAARAVACIIDVRITIPVGEPVVPLPEGDRYLGFIFSRADGPDQAEAALRQAHAMLTFDIEPAPGHAGQAEKG